MKNRCAIIGCGRVGRALAIALKNAGFTIAVLADKNRKVLDFVKNLFQSNLVTQDFQNWPEFDVLFIAVNDDAIAAVAGNLASSPLPLQNKIIAHTSGALTSELLLPVKKKHAKVASVHPVQTFSGAQNDTYKLRNSYFALEGDPEACASLEKIISKIGGKSFNIPQEFKPLHHLACVIASNYIITLMNLAAGLYESVGMTKEHVKTILLPLMKTAVEHIASQSLESALTGPIARADVNTIARHLELLQRQDNSLLKLYARLGAETVPLALAQHGSHKKNLKEIESLFKNIIGQ
jgi:predicted short-subunit dehydrogenase-like oxidoreductase (DUF2520 family)